MQNINYQKVVIFITIGILAIITSGCQKKFYKHQDSFLVFGTVVNVTLLDIDKQKAQQSFRHIREDLSVMHRVWHVWEPGPLMRMNQLLEYTTEFSAAPSVLELVLVAKDLAAKSQQLFNPAIGKLIALWGFHSHNQPETLPDEKDIKKLIQQKPSLENLKINGIRVNNNNAAVKIDLGGIAKGFAIDRIIYYLKQQGINNALIDTGGDLKVIGKHNNRPWKIAIRDPRKKSKYKKNIVASLELKDNEAAFTSGDYERYFKNKKQNDIHFHHIIDPRTGYPAKGTQSVTVLHQNATIADAAATALFIAGPEKWIEIAKSMSIKHVLLIDDNGKVHISTAMRKRVKFEQAREIIEEVSL